MFQFFQTVYGQLTIIAAIVATLWGLFKGLGALRRWLKQQMCIIKKYKDAPQTTSRLFEQLQSRMKQRDQKLIDMITSKNQQLDNKIQNMAQKIVQLKEDMYNNNEATASLALQKMMWAYHTYVLQETPIPLDVRTALVEMYNQYKKSSWHNHVPEDFVDSIMKCEVAGYEHKSKTE